MIMKLQRMLHMEARAKLTKNEELVAEVMKGMHPSVRAFTCSSAIKQDILPLLSHIIVPSFRPVNLHLFTEQERKDLNNAVSIMIDYNLSYVQERMPEGHYIYKIDPNIEDVTLFSRSKPRRELSYFNKQLIAREIELEKMRRSELHKLKENSNINNLSKNTTGKTPHVPNHLQQLKTKVIKPKGVAVAKDFFGRVITKQLPTGKSSTRFNNEIWYQFKEGYNNAVRKPIKISKLLS